MANKIKREKTQEDEDRELEEFIAAQQKTRTSLLKKVGIIIVCVLLVFAFCLPSLVSLI